MAQFKPQKPEKEVISIRLPSALLRTIDRCSLQSEISRNEFINQCITFAIQNMNKKTNA